MATATKTKPKRTATAKKPIATKAQPAKRTTTRRPTSTKVTQEGKTTIKPKSPKKTTAKAKIVKKPAVTRKRPAKQTTTTKPKAAKKTTVRSSKKSAKQQPKRLSAYVKNVWMGAYAAIAVAIPQLTLLWRPEVGVYATVVSLVLLLILAIRSEQARKLAISAAILPVTLLVSLGLPQSSTFEQTSVFYDVILVCALLYAYEYNLDGPLRISALGKQSVTTVPLMIIMGEALGALGYGLMRHGYAYRGTSLPLVAVSVVVFAISEEVLFRGLIQQQAAKVMHPVAAAALSAITYAIIFVGHDSLRLAAFALLSGAILSAIYYFKQNVILTTTSNMVMKLTYLGLVATFVLR